MPKKSRRSGLTHSTSSPSQRSLGKPPRALGALVTDALRPTDAPTASQGSAAQGGVSDEPHNVPSEGPAVRSDPILCNPPVHCGSRSTCRVVHVSPDVVSSYVCLSLSGERAEPAARIRRIRQSGGLLLSRELGGWR